MYIIEWVGFVGSFLLAGCAIPQLLKSIKTKRVDDFSGLFLSTWFIGEILMLVYILLTPNLFSIPLVINYLLNFIIVGILIGIKYEN
jgi:uncharacterized protein with PQ loop repeat